MDIIYIHVNKSLHQIYATKTLMCFKKHLTPRKSITVNFLFPQKIPQFAFAGVL